MPFSITLEPDLILVKFLGKVSARDLAEIGAAVWALEKSQRNTLSRITDLSDAEDYAVDFTAVRQLADDRKSRVFVNAFKSAIVAPKDHMLGYARMFQTLNDHPQITLRIFRDMDAAREWIAEK